MYELQNYDISPFLPILNDVITLAFQVRVPIWFLLTVFFFFRAIIH